MTTEEATVLDVHELREVARREMEMASLLGPRDDLERDWLHYLEQLVSLTNAWIARAEA